MSFRGLLNNRCDIQRVTEVIDNLGARRQTWATLYAAVPCRIQPISGREAAEFSRVDVRISHKMFCEANYTFTEKDRVKFGSRYFDIETVRDVDEMGHHLEVLLEEVD